MKKFNITSSTYGFVVDPQTSNSYLFAIGGGCDIQVYRKGVNGSYCSQSSFNYEGISNALCGKNGSSNPFTPKRITVIQMK